MNEDQIKEYNEIQDNLDRYIFIMELGIIIDEQAKYVHDFKCKSNDCFMTSIQLLMNYLNTIYTLKEFSSSFKRNEKVNQIQNDFYKNNNWYRFTIEYRNCAIHSFSLPKYYNPDDGELVIQIDEIIRKQEFLYQNESDTNKRKQIDNRIEKLQEFRKNVLSYFPCSYFAKMSFRAVYSMIERMLEAEFNDMTKDNIARLVDLYNSTLNSSVALTIENFYVNARGKLLKEGKLFSDIQNLYGALGYKSFKFYNSTEWFDNAII